MSRVVTLQDFTPGARNDGLPWTAARIEEAATATGTFSPLETFTFGVGGQPAPDTDPRAPQARDFTTALAQLDAGYYRVVFIDAGGNLQAVGPVYVPQSAQAYTSVDALRRVLSPDGSQEPTLGTAASLSDDELESAITEATVEVDARIAARYTLPFVETPPLLASLTRDIAAYLATLTYRRGDPIDPNDPVQLRYNRAQTILASVQSGKTELPVSTGPLSESADAEVVNRYDGDLFIPSDFSLGPPPYRSGVFPGAGFDDGLV